MNINKKLLALSVVLAAMGGCVIAKADMHTISLGYSHGKVTDFKNIHGVTAKYHYQPDGSLGFISSLTYMDGDKKISDHEGSGKINLQYYALLVGPSFRVNEFVSLYGLAGALHLKAKGYDVTGNNESHKLSANTFAYGAGVQIAPAANWTIDVGYEGAAFKDMKLNGFNIGLGYRF
ncbi:Ail/Lom family outer membrane beta-barrel protein [Candidatus Symbiopectobacterium sp. NZEC135]|uniref:Ail/Lom family outer membrane beta-barrel protein n=1 Tax=Candidatus Symbiopectobacterium sp. NZEC135 TaxID=2820471 RepID=UPI002227A617|nr:Ail/Lom family outer membrane beta-barrel protein [Candidatus Symbiopectobacterium sp. NZEC135]